MEIKVGQIWVPKGDTNLNQPAEVISVGKTTVTILALNNKRTYGLSKSFLLENATLAAEYLAREAFDKELEELLNE